MSQVLPKDVPSTLRQWKRYPAYKDSEVEWLGEIPEHWQAYKLKRVSEINYGLTLELDRTETEGTFIISLPNVTKEGQLVLEEVPKTPLTDEEKKSLLLRKGDLLFNWRNGSSDHVGKTAYFDADGEYTHVSFLLRLRFDLAKHDSRYYHRFINNLRNTDFFASAKTRVNNTYNQAELRQLEVVVPPQDEQQAIASFLDRETAKIDALIAKKERLIELLQEKRTTIISHAVTKGLDPTVPLEDSRVEWLGKIPTHWQVKRIRAITESIQTGPFGSQLHSEEYVSGGIPVINPSHLKDGRIEPDWDCAVDKPTWQRLSRHELDEGDIIFARRGEMGRCALVTAAEAGWLCGTGSLRMRLKRDVAYPQFLNWILSTSGVRDWLLLESVGATMDNLNTTILARVPLSVPPFDEQVAIASYLDRETTKIDALIAKIREGIEKLKEYRTALISASVTGKIDVRNEVAS